MTAKRSQAPGDRDATILKQFFVIFRRRSKRIAFLESMNFSTSMQIFNFRDGHVTTFRHHSGPIIIIIKNRTRSTKRQNKTEERTEQTLQTSKRHMHLQSLGYPSVPLVSDKTVSCRLCAGQSKDTLKTRKNAVFDLAPSTLQNSEIFHDSTTLTVCRRNRGDPSSLMYRI